MSGAGVFDAGRLRHRLALQAPVEADDGAGGVVRSYTTEATVWAALVPVPTTPASESVAADALGATVTHRITIRSGVTVTSRHRFEFGARVFRILAVRDPDESGRFIEVLAQERVD